MKTSQPRQHLGKSLPHREAASAKLLGGKKLGRLEGSVVQVDPGCKVGGVAGLTGGLSLRQVVWGCQWLTEDWRDNSKM